MSAELNVGHFENNLSGMFSLYNHEFSRDVLSLKNFSVATVGETLNKLSDAYFLEIPRSLVSLVVDYVRQYRDPRKYWNYNNGLPWGIDDLTEGAICELDDFSFYTQHSRMLPYIFQFLSVDFLHRYDILPHEYYEFEFSGYYFINNTPPCLDFHRFYCKSCIKIICDIYDYKLNVYKGYAIKTLHHDNALEEVCDTDNNYCANCFVGLLYTLNECDGYNYLDITNHWAVPYCAL